MSPPKNTAGHGLAPEQVTGAPFRLGKQWTKRINVKLSHIMYSFILGSFRDCLRPAVRDVSFLL